MWRALGSHAWCCTRCVLASNCLAACVWFWRADTPAMLRALRFCLGTTAKIRCTRARTACVSGTMGQARGRSAAPQVAARQRADHRLLPPAPQRGRRGAPACADCPRGTSYPSRTCCCQSSCCPASATLVRKAHCSLLLGLNNRAVRSRLEVAGPSSPQAQHLCSAATCMNVCTQLPACAQASQPACRMYLVHCSSGTPSADTMHNEQHDGTKLLWFSRGSRAGTRGASVRTRCDERAPASPVAACAAAAAPASMRHSSSRACSRSTVSPARPSRSGSSAASHRSAKGTLERAPAARRAHPTVRQQSRRSAF